MMTKGRRFAGAAGLLIVMAAVSWGCESGQETSPGRAASEAASDKRAVSDTTKGGSLSAKEQIEAVLRQIQEDYDVGDGEAYCAKLIDSEQREVAAFGRRVDRGTTCARTIKVSSRVGKRKGIEQRPTRFISARVTGRRALAKVSNGGRPPEPMVFLKRGGKWKVVESGFEPDPFSAPPRAEKNARVSTR